MNDGEGSGHASWRSFGARHRAGGRRGQTPDAPDRRPRQTRGHLRRNLPARRLRAVQPGQRGHPADLRAHPVQVALPGPAHHHHLADVEPARQLRHPRPCPAAPRPALVPRQRRRHPAVPEPGARRTARVRRRLRRRPRVPDGPAPDARPAHRVRRGRDRRGDTGPARRVAVLRRDHARLRRADRHRLPGEAGRPSRSRRRPRVRLRLDGQLRLHHQGPRRGPAPGRRGRELRARHGPARSCPSSPTGARPRCTTSAPTTSPGRPPGTRATGGTWARWTPTTTPTWT